MGDSHVDSYEDSLTRALCILTDRLGGDATITHDEAEALDPRRYRIDSTATATRIHHPRAELAPAVWLVQRYHAWDERDTPRLLWFAELDAALVWAERNVDRNHSTEVLELTHDQGVEVVEAFGWSPEPYTGELARARISKPLNSDRELGLIVHRTPVDCWTPRPDVELDETRLVRMLRNSLGESSDECRRNAVAELRDPTDREARAFVCLCGTWQHLEGEPTAVAELARKYPPRPGTPPAD